MAYYSKEIYERKQAYADRRMRNNAEIETLTEEQHDYLSELCSFRHKLHTNHESLFNENSTAYDDISQEISEWSPDTPLRDRGYELFNEYPFDTINWNTNEDIMDILEDDGIEYDTHEYWEQFDELKSQSFDLFEQVNKQIENFLFKIDKQHGTSYCPTGLSRI